MFKKNKQQTRNNNIPIKHDSELALVLFIDSDKEKCRCRCVYSVHHVILAVEREMHVIYTLVYHVVRSSVVCRHQQ